jgi:hypothetical protein
MDIAKQIPSDPMKQFPFLGQNHTSYLPGNLHMRTKKHQLVRKEVDGCVWACCRCNMSAGMTIFINNCPTTECQHRRCLYCPTEMNDPQDLDVRLKIPNQNHSKSVTGRNVGDYCQQTTIPLCR